MGSDRSTLTTHTSCRDCRRLEFSITGGRRHNSRVAAAVLPLPAKCMFAV